MGLWIYDYVSKAIEIWTVSNDWLIDAHLFDVATKQEKSGTCIVKWK